MSKLLARAEVKLENAQRNYLKIQQDDAYLDDCCYNLQQCIEMALKYIVEMNGEDYIPNHDLRAQLNILSGINVSVPGADELRNMAATINSWEAESRYKEDFFGMIEDVDQAMQIAKELVAYGKTLGTEHDAENKDFPERQIE